MKARFTLDIDNCLIVTELLDFFSPRAFSSLDLFCPVYCFSLHRRVTSVWYVLNVHSYLKVT